MPQLVYLGQKTLLKLILLIKYKNCLRNISWLTKWFVMWKMIAQIYLQWRMILNKLSPMNNWDIGTIWRCLFLLCPFQSLPIWLFKEKVSLNLQLVNIKSTKSSIQACITWFKNLGKWRVKWTKAYLAKVCDHVS
jgi:hypothetical protein